MQPQQRKFLVAVISLFAFLTPASGGLDSINWNSTPAGASADAQLTLAACEYDCDDDMHW